MNLYHCFIDLKDDAKALAFAQALEQWMERLKAEKVILAWRLMRLKLNLAAEGYSDFMLEIEVQDMGQLDSAFRMLGRRDDQIDALYSRVHAMVGRSRFALYRPYPDAERAERMALI